MTTDRPMDIEQALAWADSAARRPDFMKGCDAQALATFAEYVRAHRSRTEARVQDAKSSEAACCGTMSALRTLMLESRGRRSRGISEEQRIASRLFIDARPEEFRRTPPIGFCPWCGTSI